VAYNIKMDFRAVSWEVGTCSKSCPVTDIGIGGAEYSGSATKNLSSFVAVRFLVHVLAVYCTAYYK
jgi:hypothetical protein